MFFARSFSKLLAFFVTGFEDLCYFPVISDRKVTKGTLLKGEVS